MISGLGQGEDLPPNSAIISEDAALRTFGTVDVLGRRMLLNNRVDIAIVGVSQKFNSPSHLESSIAMFNTDLYVPMAILDARRRDLRRAAGADPDADYWGNQSDYVYLEFPPELAIDVAEFNERLDDFVQVTLPPDRAEFMTYRIQPVNQMITSQVAIVTGGFDVTDVLIVAGALVLLIGCLNYSNLVIAQLSLRSQEIAVQKILGSKRSLLIVQYCYESFLFMLLALFLSLLIFAFLLLSFQSQGMPGVSMAMLINPALWTALGFVMLFIVLIAGCYPAVRTASVSLVSMMRPKGSGGYSGRLRAIMVGVQYFISATLMILAIVMYSQNQAMTSQLDGDSLDPKILIDVPVDTFTVDPDLLVSRLTSHPAIISATRVDTPPWAISVSTITLTKTPDQNGEEFEMANNDVGYDYLDTMGTALLGGREFSRERGSDAFPSYSSLAPGMGPYALLVDEEAAATLGWDNAQDALGQTVYQQLGPPAIEREMAIGFSIVGIVGAQKYQFIDFGNFGVSGQVYTLQPASANNMILKVARGDVNNALRHLDDTWRELMPQIALKREFVDDLFDEGYSLFLSISLAIATLSVFGFLIASIGLLGNATFITNIRQKEVGIRKVMGASSMRLFRMLLLDFAKPILIANALAWPLGYIIGNFYISLFAARAEVTALPFVVSLLLSVFIAIAAVGSQSWKSAKVRPAAVLRYE
ncbi:MAG: ABC transporter permease [Pseudohongiella sp.]|nr:MAG: ABC transporter permease [Pseudohongiella sp.]